MTDNTALRAAAIQIACPDCIANNGQPCLNLSTGQPLKRQPAHMRRLKNAELLGLLTLPPLPPHPDDEFARERL